MNKDEERKLVEEARKNPEAFGKLFEIYYSKILRYAIFRTGNVEIARDITAETFYKAVKNLWQFRFLGKTFSAWLYRIAGNLIVDYFRHKKTESVILKSFLRQMKIENQISIINIENEVIEDQKQLDKNKDYEEIKQALFKLPVLYQEVLVLRYIENYKIKEICEILNKKEGTVKSLISRGIGLLKLLMQPSSAISVKNGEQ